MLPLNAVSWPVCRNRLSAEHEIEVTLLTETALMDQRRGGERCEPKLCDWYDRKPATGKRRKRRIKMRRNIIFSAVLVVILLAMPLALHA
jgi:hypothetical protein